MSGTRSVITNQTETLATLMTAYSIADLSVKLQLIKCLTFNRTFKIIYNFMQQCQDHFLKPIAHKITFL